MRKKIQTWRAQLRRYDVANGCTLDEFLRQIEDIVAEIPKEHRAGISVDWTEGDPGYESDSIEFTFSRDETDQEMAVRETAEARREHGRQYLQERQERALLERLKAKYETKKP
jgi:hypothetical protein